MASFASPSNLPIAEYVSAIDPQLYGQVITQKQALYDQGVAKVNASLSTIAGIEVIKDAHKQYLNNTVRGLQTDVQKLAGEDFSKQNVVNQALGLASRVAKDPVIQNAMLSTQNYKKALNQRDQYIKDGKTSVENDWYFNQQVNQWLYDGNESSQFNTSYTPYSDVNKKAIEIIQKLKPNVNISENPFIVDPATGQMVLNDVLVKNELKELSPQQVRNALMTGLDSADFNQLNITGAYKYQGLNPEILSAEISSNFNSQIQTIDNKIKTLNDKKSGLSNGQSVQDLDIQITNLTNERKSLENKLSSYNDAIRNGNIAGVTGRVYTDEFLNSISDAFSYEETSQSIENNPYMQMKLEREKFNFQVNKWQEEKVLKERELEQKAGGPGSSLPLPITQQPANIDAAKDRAIQSQNSAQQAKRDLFNYIGKADEQWYTEQEKLYDQGKQMDPIIKDYISEIRDYQSRAADITQSISRIEQEANRRYPLDLSNIKLPTNAQGLNFQLSGRRFDFTPEELAAYTVKKNTLRNIGWLQPISFVAKAIVGERTEAANQFINTEFTEKERALFNIEDKIPTRAYDNRASNMDRKILQTLNSYSSSIKSGDIGNLKERQEYIQSEINNTFDVRQSKSFAIPTGKAAERQDIRNKVNQLITRGYQMEGGLGNGLEVEDIEKINNDKNTTYELIVNPSSSISDKSYQLVLQTEGEEPITIPLTPEDKVSLFGLQYEPPTESFNRIANRLRVTGNSTTNFDNTFDPTKAAANSLFKPSDFPAVTDFSVSGDVVSKNGRYSAVLYVYDPLIEKKIVRRVYTPPSGLMDEGGLLRFMQGLNTESVFELLYDKVPSAQDIQELKNANKKPD